MVRLMGAENSRIGIIGFGRMGRCLAKGWIESKSFSAKDLTFTSRTAASAEKVKAEFSIQ